MTRLLAIFCCCSLALTAQSNLSTVTGVITDPSAAVIVGATLQARNLETGIVLSATTNDSGVFLLNALTPGRYAIEAQAPGFKSSVRPDVKLDVSQRLRVDFTLSPGDVQERVEVTGTTTLLQQESAEISDTITATEVRNIPLNGRNPFSLLALSAGVVSNSNSADGISSADISINGSRPSQNMFIVDGAPTMTQSGNGERIGPIESVQEFKVLGSTYSAEYGRSSGATVTFQVKSGTQQLRGVLYEFHRNSALDANRWENNARSVRQPALIRNEFGAALGGPVPGTRQRLFYFGTYEGVRDRIPVTRIRTIPDAALRSGDFSSVPVIVNDPLTGRPFPGNRIPAERLDPAAVRLLGLFPTPNSAGNFSSAFGIRTSNWVRTSSSNDDKNYGVGRLDWNPTDTIRLFGTYTHFHEYPARVGAEFDNALDTQQGFRLRHMKRLSLSYSNVLRPNLIHEITAYALRDPRDLNLPVPDFDVSRELGIQRTVGTTLPIINITGYGNFGNGTQQGRVNQVPGVTSALTWQAGRHSVRGGVQFQQNTMWQFPRQNLSGQYGFSGTVTGLGTAGANNPIFGLADLLLGAVTTASYNVVQIPTNRYNWYFGGFVQDDWKLTNRVTLNLGLRYEFETRLATRNNVFSAPDLATGNLLVAGRNTSANLGLKNDYVNFSPRVGIAWSLNDRTVLRTGFGIFHSSFFFDNGTEVTYPGWSRSQNFPAPPVGQAQAFRFSEGFPLVAEGITDPLALFAQATPQNPLPVNSPAYVNSKLPYNVQWNASVQRALPFGIVGEAAYVASRGVHLDRTIAANSPGLERAEDVNIRRVQLQLVRPYPRFSGFNAVFYDGNSIYHSLQVKGTRRFAQGFSVDANYTWSKNIDDTTSVDDSFQIPWQNARIERAVSSLDRTHLFTAAVVYELPFGRGKPLASRGWASWVLGGFQVNGLISTGSGQPFTIRQANLNTILSAQRPNVIDPSRVDGRLDEPVFEGTALRYLIPRGAAGFPFADSANIGIGNLGRNTSRAPGFVSTNLSLFRSFAFSERAAIQIRLEAFNALNTVNFLTPSSNISTPEYGLITSTAGPRQVQIGARLTF